VNLYIFMYLKLSGCLFEIKVLQDIIIYVNFSETTCKLHAVYLTSPYVASYANIV
jgi:hypothetical protein